MEKNYAEVLIDGTVYTLGGAEDEAYIRQAAAYLNDKVRRQRQQSGFSRLSAEKQAVLLQINLVDDYFKEKDRAGCLEEEKAELEKEVYSLRHELVTIQIRLEALQGEKEALRKENAALQRALEEGCRAAQTVGRAETPAGTGSGQQPFKSAGQALETASAGSGEAAEADAGQEPAGEPASETPETGRQKEELEKKKALQAAAHAAGRSKRR